MSRVPLPCDLETRGEYNARAPLFNGKGTMEQVQRLDFLKLSARYLGQTLTTRRLHLLAGLLD
jgi:hypothetical protein